MDSTVFKAFDSIKLPGVEETKKQAMQESILFPAVNEISAEWIRQSQIYHFLFGIIFKERTGVERVEERILKRAIAPAREDWMIVSCCVYVMKEKIQTRFKKHLLW